MRLKIALIANRVFPIPPLPDGLLTFRNATVGSLIETLSTTEAKDRVNAALIKRTRLG